MYATVAVPVPLFRTFTYAVPPELAGRTLTGCRVVVPFGRRTLTGVVVGHEEKTDVPPEKIKAILDVLDDAPGFTGEMLRFAAWLSEYYLSPLGETLRSMLPQGLAQGSGERVALAVDIDNDILTGLRRSAPRQAAILAVLRDHPNGVTASFLQKKVGAESLHAQLAGLEAKGLIRRKQYVKKAAEARTVRGVRFTDHYYGDETALPELLDALDKSAPRQAAILQTLYLHAERTGNMLVYASELLHSSGAPESALKALATKGVIELEEVEVSREEILSGDDDEHGPITEGNTSSIVPNHDQAIAIEAISAAMAAGEFRTFLLHGVTGSGKTQVYIEVIRRALAAGKRALVLVPEIALTFQLVERFRSVFGQSIVVMHSRMSDGERYDGWRRAASGGCDVVIGARSALFAPLENLGVVVVDEEHDASYKQYDLQPRYNARDAAVVRAQLAGAVVVLGSATPSVESYYNAQRGKYVMLQLPERVDNAREPRIVIVDTLTARKQRLMRGSLSVKLLADIRSKIGRGEGVILLQNRRGFASRLECSSCGHSPMCPNCAVTLTYHKQHGELRCHYCGFVKGVTSQCEVCNANDLRQPGVGTQKVEEELAANLPGARVMRMDLDTTSKKGSHKKMLASFANGETDVLLGTQMVSKGLDFPRVSLVGVISADTQLLLPDFRASERTFQLLTQVAGRAGRRSELEGEVVIQTSHPHHPAVMAAFTKDYLMMYNEEVSTRRELNYPPFSRFIIVEFRSEDRAEAEEHARYFRTLLPGHQPSVLVLGPTAALIWKLRNLYRYQIIIKNIRALDPGGRQFSAIFADAHDRYRAAHQKSDVQLIVDVDAQGM